jgi:hypothetical protein
LGVDAAAFGLAAAFRAGALRAAGAALFVGFFVWRVAAMEQSPSLRFKHIESALAARLQERNKRLSGSTMFHSVACRVELCALHYELVIERRSLTGMTERGKWLLRGRLNRLALMAAALAESRIHSTV